MNGIHLNGDESESKVRHLAGGTALSVRNGGGILGKGRISAREEGLTFNSRNHTIVSIMGSHERGKGLLSTIIK